METFSALLAICAENSPVPVNSPHKGQWRGALMFSLICVWINDWVNNGEAGDLRRYRIHYDVTVMRKYVTIHQQSMKCIYKRSKILKYLKIKKMHECLKTQQPHWQTGPGHFNIRCLKSKREDASFRWEGREFQILAAWYVKVLGKDETRNIQALGFGVPFVRDLTVITIPMRVFNSKIKMTK